MEYRIECAVIPDLRVTESIKWRPMKTDSWLVVANSSIARIYRLENRHTLLEITVLEHPESRLNNLDIVSDKPGRDFERMGMTRHGVGHCTTPKKHEFEVFASEIAAFLKHGRLNGRFDKLYLTAGPNLLGLLREALDEGTVKIIHGETDKDFTQLKPSEILAHLPFFG